MAHGQTNPHNDMLDIGAPTAAFPGDTGGGDPEGLVAWSERYLEWKAIHNYSPRTVTCRRVELRTFLKWCDERGVQRPEEVDKAILEAYQRFLFYKRKADGKPLHSRSQRCLLTAMAGLFEWLCKQNVLFFNPAADLQLPKEEKRLAMTVLTPAEVDAVINEADITTVFGLRDRAMMEVLYSTAVRRFELIGLNLQDIDFGRGVVHVRKGKGAKDRVVPIGERALAWLQKYLQEARPKLEVSSADVEDALFLSRLGRRLSKTYLTGLTSGYVRAADIGKTGANHLFRRTVGTQMLDNGADIRHVQEMLGHEDIKSTQVYTRVAIRKLQEVHAKTHPGAGFGRAEE